MASAPWVLRRHRRTQVEDATDEDEDGDREPGGLAVAGREGGAQDQDEMPLLQILLLAHETDAQSYRAGVPVRLQRAASPLVSRIARLRGYRASYD